MTNRRNDLVLIGLFTAVVFAPLLRMALGPAAKSTENRKLKPPPVFRNVDDWPREFEAYFNDNFGLRPSLVKLNSYARLTVAGVSSSPKVVVGKDGWLFYDAEAAGENAGLAAARGEKPFAPERLAAVARNLEKREALLRRRGIRVLNVVCPDKHQIYPEELPSSVAPPTAASRLDQILGATKTKVLDLRPALLREKGRGRLYFKTDTHWTSAGAFIGSIEVLRTLGKPAPSLADYRMIETGLKAGDLAELLLLGQEKVERETAFEPLSPEKPVKPAGKLLVYHDSFYKYIGPYIDPRFKTVVHAQHLSASDPLDLKLVDKEKPDTVLFITVERHWAD